MTHAWVEADGGFTPLTGTLEEDPDGTTVIVLEVETFENGETDGA
jgi:hypothetical protein